MTLSFVICCKGNTKIRFGKENEDFINWDIFSASFATRFCCLVSGLSQIAARVVTTSGESLRNICESSKTVVALHRQSDKTTSERQDKTVSITI
jgi:hypothetical protein